MDTKQILNILKNTVGESFLGVFPSDKIPKLSIKETPCSLVINTDPSTKPGTHWVAIYANSNGSAEYFDSYGFPPKVPAILRFLKKFKSWKYSTKRIQSLFSSVCGNYSVYFVLQRSNNIPMQKILQKFSKNHEENDEMITEWINENFDLDTQTYNLDFLVNQICRAFDLVP